MDINSYKGVWTYAEQHDGVLTSVAIELLGEGRKLANELDVELCAVLMGEDIAGLAKDLIAFGADKVYVADDPELKLYRNDAYAKVFKEAIDQYKPEIVLIGATHDGRDLAPSVAAMLETGLTADCTILGINEDKNLVQTRPAFGGNLMAEIMTTQHRPQMATVRPGVMEKAKADESNTGEVIELAVSFEPGEIRQTILEQVREVVDEVSISEADVLVAGGMGLGSAEGFELLKQLAGVFSNATIAGSRAAVDEGWIEHSHQVGQTGTTVKPNVYFACGISGMIQHVAGMKGAKYIVAINKNPDAEIFEIADYGIVGDLYEVIPALIEQLEAKKALMAE